jgi:hypothetical protein
MVDQTYLVFSVLFENNNAFKELSKESCKNLLDVSCSMCVKNKNIKEAMNKYQITHLHKLVQKNVRKMMFTKDEDARELLLQKQQAIFDSITNEEILDGLKRLVIADFKELVYESMYFPYFTDQERMEMQGYCELIKHHFGENAAYNHVHDPSHHIFSGEPCYYMFYYYVEIKGTSIMDHSICLEDYELEDDEP